MGTVALSVVAQGVSNVLRSVSADVTLSASYATGGDTIPLAPLGLREVVEAIVHTGTLGEDTGRSGTTFSPNNHGVQLVIAGTRTAPKFKVFNGSSTEVANTTNLSATNPVRVEFRGH